MLTLYDTWTNIKNIVSVNELKIQYLESMNLYKVWVVYEQNIYIIELWKNTDNIDGIDIEQNNLDLTDFENNYKEQADGIANEAGVTNLGSQSMETVPLNNRIYKCQELDVTAGEQEYDLGSIFTEFTLMVTGSENVIVKLNDTNNDEIPLKGGQDLRDVIGADTFELSKIYYKTIGSGITSKIFLWAMKR